MRDVLVRKGRIAAVEPQLPADAAPAGRTVDAQGLVLSPGLVDARVCIGEPGFERRETIRSAGRAAAAGGVTTMVTLPDTAPVIDDPALVGFVRQRAKERCKVRVRPTAAMTRGLDGRHMTEFGLLSEAGAIALTDGKRTVADAQIMRRALTYARNFDLLVMAHTQEPSLSGGVVNAGPAALRLGLPGTPALAEVMALERDLRLVEMTGARYHAAAISTARSLDVIREARRRGLDVTCAVPVANLCLSDNDIGAYRTFLKLSPPLRSEDDRLAMIEGVRDGTVDMIVSNHDPQEEDTKRLPFAEAADGAVGLETLLAACLRLHFTDGVPLPRLLECLTCGPARRLRLKSGSLQVGRKADLVLFDPEEPWIVTTDDLHSRSRNTPFENARMSGRVVRTLVGGRTVFSLRRGDGHVG